jgi:hypothetical protein
MSDIVRDQPGEMGKTGKTGKPPAGPLGAWALVWSAWQPHHGCWLGDAAPCTPGLYRVRLYGNVLH